MPKPRVYVETTIPSTYYSDRSDPEMVRNQLLTRRWWAGVLATGELVTSTAVIDEVRRGRSRHVPARLAMLDALWRLESDADVLATAAVYIRRKAMPADPLGDALHLALASHHKCDLLVTWNYRHLANHNKLNHIRHINGELGLFVPRITSPETLLKEGE